MGANRHRRRPTRKDTRELIAFALDLGYVLDGWTGKDHPKVRHSMTGQVVTLQATGSDWRGTLNARAQLRRGAQQEESATVPDSTTMPDDSGRPQLTDDNHSATMGASLTEESQPWTATNPPPRQSPTSSDVSTTPIASTADESPNSTKSAPPQPSVIPADVSTNTTRSKTETGSHAPPQEVLAMNPAARRNYTCTPAFVDLLRATMQQNNLSIAEFAELVGLHPSAFHGVFGGRTKQMYAASVEKIAKATDIPITEFRKASNRKRYDPAYRPLSQTVAAAVAGYVAPEEQTEAPTEPQEQQTRAPKQVSYPDAAPAGNLATLTLSLPPRAKALSEQEQNALMQRAQESIAAWVNDALDRKFS